MTAPHPGVVLGGALLQALLWAPALLATTVVWPYRELTGRWPVVAYTLGLPDEAHVCYQQTVAGRAEAAALAARWAADIRRYGRPQSVEPVHVTPDRTRLTGL